MIDWNAPIMAVPVEGWHGHADVVIDKEYHREDGKVPIKFSCNVFTGGMPKGTWYFNDLGFAIGGMDASGEYDAKFTVVNRI